MAKKEKGGTTRQKSETDSEKEKSRKRENPSPGNHRQNRTASNTAITAAENRIKT